MHSANIELPAPCSNPSTAPEKSLLLRSVPLLSLLLMLLLPADPTSSTEPIMRRSSGRIPSR